MAQLLYPLFESVIFQDKTPLIRLEPRSQEHLDALYFYADHIKAMGARSVLFLPKDSEVTVLDLEGKSVTLKVQSADPAELRKYGEWIRVAGAKHVFVLQSNETLEIGESDGNYEI